MDSSLIYTDESIRICKDLAAFYKKRHAIEMEYAKEMARLAHIAQKFQFPTGLAFASDKKSALFRSRILNSPLWKKFASGIDQAANVAQIHLFDRIDDTEKRFYELTSNSKKYKKELDLCQAQYNDIAESLLQAKSNADGKALLKLQPKMESSSSKLSQIQQHYGASELKLQQFAHEYRSEIVPNYIDEIEKQESNRVDYILKIFKTTNNLESLALSKILNAYNLSAQTMIQQDFISEQMKDLQFIHQEIIENISDDLSVTAVQDLKAFSKFGNLLIKKENVKSGWKMRHVRFNQTQRTLSIYDDVESLRPRQVYKMTNCFVYELDSVYYGRPCFQIIETSMAGQQIIKFLAETENDVKEWVSVLRLYTYCCQTCSKVYEFDPERKINQNWSDPNSLLLRSLHVTICEAKELTSKSVNPYFIVQLDDTKYYRSSIKNSSNPKWSESISVNLAPHFTTLYANFFNAQKVQVYLGSVSIDLSSIKPYETIDMWLPLKIGNTEESQENIGLIRLIIRLMFLLEPPYLIIKEFFGSCEDRDELVRCFSKILLASDTYKAAINYLIKEEVSETVDANVILRGNTLGIKIVDQIIKYFAADYVKIILTPLIESIYQQENLALSEAPHSQMLELIKYTWENIRSKIDACPMEIKNILAIIRLHTQERFPNEVDVHLSGISGFVFLRFFGPAIISPVKYGITDKAPGTFQSKALTSIAKVFQSMANLKSSHTNEFGQFIEQEMPNMRDYLSAISTNCDGESKNVVNMEACKEELNLLLVKYEFSKTNPPKGFVKEFNERVMKMKEKATSQLCSMKAAMLKSPLDRARKHAVISLSRDLFSVQDETPSPMIEKPDLRKSLSYML